MTTVAEASNRRVERLMEEEVDKRIDLLLAGTHGENPGDRYHAVTANPRTMGYLRFLLRYYAKFPHPWTKCVAPDTPIDSPRDHAKYPLGIPISQLRAGDLVWSFNSHLHIFELKPIQWVASIRSDAQLAMLTLDDGAQIKATPDHKFMRRDGSWAELQDLSPGDSLMPFYRDYLPMVRLSPDRAQWVTEHEQVARMWGERENKHVHHLDERRANTDPKNLALLTSSEHASLHHATAREKLATRGEMRKCRYCSTVFAPQHRNHFTCGECPGSAKYIKIAVGTTRVCVTCDSEFTVNSANQKFCSAECRAEAGDNPKRSVTCSECGSAFETRRKNAVFCADCRRKPTEQPMANTRICRNCGAEFMPASGAQRHCSAECRVTFSKRAYEERNPGAHAFNHKVVGVVLLDEYSDVWDMEVEDNHSFVTLGVVAHNCVADNFKRFGPKAKGLCAVVKDTVRQTAMWRHGAPRGLHPGHPDTGSPGVAIAEADKWAAPAWGGHHHMSEGRPLSLLDELDMEFGAVDHTVPLGEAATILCSIGEKCDVYRVLIGLDDPPALNLAEVLA